MASMDGTVRKMEYMTGKEIINLINKLEEEGMSAEKMSFFYIIHFSSVNICKHKKTPQNLGFTALLKQGKRGSNPHLRFWRPLLYH